jgi:fucose permease
MERRRASWLLLGLSCVAFVGLGLPDGVLGVAWPSIRAEFGLPLDALGALLVAQTAGYMASSFVSGPLLSRLGLGALLALSCLGTAASLLGYAVAPVYAAMVALGALAGLGAGAIDAALNSHVARRHSARTVSLLHAFYGVGTSAGPALMTSVLMAGLVWQRGYVLVGAAQLALAAAFAATLRLWPAAETPEGEAVAAAPLRSTLRLRSARLGGATFFLYVGVEALAGAWIFSLLHQSRGVAMGAAGTAVSAYWAGLMLGRLAFALHPRRVSPSGIVGPCIGTAVLASALLALDPGQRIGLGAIGLLGFAFGPIFPALIASTPERAPGSHTANAVGLQIALAALGQSALPAGAGILAAASSLEAVPLALLGATLLLWLCHRALERSVHSRLQSSKLSPSRAGTRSKGRGRLRASAKRRSRSASVWSGS